MQDTRTSDPREEPQVADVLSDHPDLLESLARAALTSHVSAAAVRAQRTALPEVYRSIQEIVKLASAANPKGEDHSP